MRHIIFLNGIWPENANFNRAIGPYQLKHWISHFGFKGQVIDFCQLLTTEEIVKSVEYFIGNETLAIGVSTTFWEGAPVPLMPKNIQEALVILKDRYPNIKQIAGGARTPKVNGFDYVFAGDSEDALVLWLQELSGKRSISLFNKRFDITNLTHRFDSNDAIMQNEVLPIELGRGCIFKCKFCSHKNLGKPKNTYQRKFDLFLDEVRWNKEQWGVQNYLFLDDTVNEDMDKIENLAKAKNTLQFPINWVGYLRADLVWAKQGSAELLKESGLKSCFFGIESFHPDAGKAIDKGWAPKHGKEYIPKLYNDIWNKDINIHCNFIIGLPGEDKDSINETHKWCLDNPIGHHRFVALTLFLEKHDILTQSEFTKDYAKYGYVNVNEQTGYWENGSINSTEAAEMCKSLNQRLTYSNKMSCWNAFSALNLGIPYEHIHNWPATLIHREIPSKKAIFKAKYLELLSQIKS